jgi:hypothetical protein
VSGWRRYLPFAAGREPARTVSSPPTHDPILEETPDSNLSPSASATSGSRPARSAKVTARQNIARTVNNWDS